MGGELGHDGAAVDPDLLAADQTVAEAEHVEDAEADSTSMTGDSEHFPDDRAGHGLLQDHVVAVEEPVERFLSFGAEVGGKESVELAGRVFTGTGRTRRPYVVMNDVVCIHRDRPLDVPGSFRLEVLFDHSDHLLLVHQDPLPLLASP
jgi:hypothetical protein